MIRPLFPPERLTRFAPQCACGRLILSPSVVSRVLDDFLVEWAQSCPKSKERAALVDFNLGLKLHLAQCDGLGEQSECAACVQRRSLDRYRRDGLSLTASLAETNVGQAERFYQSASYRKHEEIAADLIREKIELLGGQHAQH